MEFRNPTEDGILQHLADKRAGNFDIIFKDKNDFTAGSNDKGEVTTIYSEPQVQIGGSALSQMLSRCEVPGAFFTKCPPSLKNMILQTFVNGRTFMARVKKVTYADTGMPVHYARAMMTPGYTPLDDHQIFPAVMDELQEAGVTNHKSFKYDDHITSLTTAINEENTELSYYACVTVTNSETGHSSIWIEPSIVFKDTGVQISNRAALRRHMSRFIHRGTRTEQEIKDAVAFAKEVAQLGLIQLMEEGDKHITFIQASEFLNSMDFFPKRFVMIAEEELKDQQDITKMELIKKICEQAKELPLLQQIAVEQASGKFLGLFDKFEQIKSRIASIDAED